MINIVGIILANYVPVCTPSRPNKPPITKQNKTKNTKKINPFQNGNRRNRITKEESDPKFNPAYLKTKLGAESGAWNSYSASQPVQINPILNLALCNMVILRCHTIADPSET